MKLSDGEKLILIMLSDIHKHLGIENGVDPKFVATAIHSGNIWGLEWKFPGIFDAGETSDEVRKEVIDILEMWSMIEAGYKNLSAEDKARIAAEATPLGNNVQFNGFDGNNEAEYIGVAKFLINDLDRYEEFKGRSLNSHMRSLDKHRRMLSVFAPLHDSLTFGSMSADLIIRILKGQIHPELQ